MRVRRPLAVITAALVAAGTLVLGSANAANAGTIRTHYYGKNYFSCLYQSNVQHTKYARQYHDAYISVNCKRLAYGGDWQYGSQFRLGERK